MRTLVNFNLNGQKTLSSLLSESEYGSLSQAVASLAVFSHPDTVAQIGCRNVFQIVRVKSSSERGEITSQVDGTRVMLDDNKGPTDAFIWVHGWKRNTYTDLQFNHVWSLSDVVFAYTNLANLCVMPAFLSKLSDTHPEIKDLLRYRSYKEFGFLPQGEEPPKKPNGYNDLNWADPLSPVPRAEEIYRKAMKSKPKDRTTKSARELGWVFSDFKPDPTLPGV